jgi:hypothetical protein
LIDLPVYVSYERTFVSLSEEVLNNVPDNENMPVGLGAYFVYQVGIFGPNCLQSHWSLYYAVCNFHL